MIQYSHIQRQRSGAKGERAKIYGGANMEKENRTQKNVSDGVLRYPNGQEAQLKKLMGQAIKVIGIGVFLLVMCICRTLRP